MIVYRHVISRISISQTDRESKIKGCNSGESLAEQDTSTRAILL
jgi:hypothetical protein